MIHKGLTISSTENVTLMEFGEGDILISSPECKGPSNIAHIAFYQADDSFEIGSLVEKEKSTLNLVMSFDKPESLDVLIKAAMRARAHLDPMYGVKETPKQKETRIYIEKFIVEMGYPPTYENIQTHFGLSSMGSAWNLAVNCRHLMLDKKSKNTYHKRKQ